MSAILMHPAIVVAEMKMQQNAYTLQPGVSNRVIKYKKQPH